MKPSAYYDPDAIAREVQAGRHRAAIGGLWEEMGKLQLDFLKAQGLQPQHTLLDIGCGALRFGHLAVEYLEAGRYFGQDLSTELLEAGYTHELSDALRAKLPRKNLAANAVFDFSHVNVPVDVALAQSVFTHLPFNHIRQCLLQLSTVMVRGGIFFATYFECPESHPLSESLAQQGAIDGVPVVTSSLTDPYHYPLRDFNYSIYNTAWQLEVVGEWSHPRGQKMLKFIFN